MKLSLATVLALAVSSADAYSVSRSTLRNLGQKSVGSAARANYSNKSEMKMEDFGIFSGTSLGFDDNWKGCEVISETALEKRLNKDGLRFRMNRTQQEADAIGVLGGGSLPGIELNLPIIGKTYIGPPKVESIWEALGFTATSNNEARQKEKLKAIDNARVANKGVLNGPGASIRGEWLEKYGYPRLVGSGGIFYADQLSTDKVPMGGFNMGKSGSIWPVPEVVEKGQYGGEKGWGMKKKGLTVDGLKPASKI